MTDLGGGGFPWDVLGLPPTPDEKAIRTAYAARVRQYRPDSHPLEFSRIREAYESAMEQARYLRVLQEAEAAEQEEEAAEGNPGPLAQDAPQPVPREPDAADAVPDASPGLHPLPVPVAVPWQGPARPAVHIPVPDKEEEDDPLPGWQPHEAVQALSDVHNTQGEIAAAALLREHLEQSARATIDARLDYEALLLRSLLVSDMPPLALVFEGNRCFGWSQRLDDVAHAFGDRAARRLALLAEMADRWLYASQYSPNGWDRRLFAPPGLRLPWCAAAGLLHAAHGTAAEWMRDCELAELPSLRSRLNPRALQRMQSPPVLVPDLGLALMALLLCIDALVELGLPGTHPGLTAGLAAGAFAATLLCCLGVRWCLRRRIAYPLRAALAWLGAHPFLGLLLLGGLLGGGAFALDAPWAPLQKLGTAALGMALASLFALALWLVWFAAQGLENAVLRLALQPLAAVARHAFREQRQHAAAPWRAPPLRQRLRLLPAAWKTERAQKQLDRQRRKAAGEGRKLSDWWWLLPLLAGVVNAVSHLGK